MKEQFWALLGISLTAFLASLDFAIVNTALPAIQITFKTTVTELQWVMNAFVIVQALLLVTMGKLGDIIGHKKLLYIGVIVFTLASVLCGIAPNIDWLIFGRAIQGASVGILIPCSLAMTAGLVPEKDQGKAIGLWSAISGIAFASGPVIGGFIIAGSSWPFIFYVNIPIAIIALLLMRICVKKEPPKLLHQLYISNILSLAVFVFSLIYLIIQAPQLNWNIKFIAGFLLLIIASGWAYFTLEKKRTQPIIDLGLFKNRVFMAGVVSNFCMVGFAFASFFLIPLFLSGIRHELDYQVGLMLLPITLAMVILSPIVGNIVDKHGFRIPLIFGLACLAASALLQALTGQFIHIFGLLIGFILMGIGWGCIFGASATAAIASLPKDQSGTATGTLWTLQNIGGALGLTVITLIYELLHHAGYSMATVYPISMFVLLAISVVACCIVARLLRKKGK